MEGLEISEVRIKDLDSQKRIDAELYNKTYVTFKTAMHNFCHTTLGAECSMVRKGIFDIKSSQYCDSGIPFVRISNMKDMTIDVSDIVYIPLSEHIRNLKTELQYGDIVLSKTAIAAASFVNVRECNVSQDVVAVKLKTDSQLLSHYVVVFLNTKYGIEQLQRRFTGNIQMHLNLDECKNEIVIPVLSPELQLKTKVLLENAIENSKESIKTYQEAKEILLKELGLWGWEPTNDNKSIKHFIDFITSGRLDAEFYQPKYDELEAIIKKSPYRTIAELQTYNARGVQPDYENDGEIPVVNSKHILEDGLDYDNFEHTTKDFLGSHERARIGQGDILIYTTGANIGRAQVYLKEESAVASNHVNILRVQGVNPIYLAIVLNSQVGRMQTEKLCTGSAQAELYPTDIEKFVVPILPDKTQQTIADYIQKSVSLRQKAKQLLEDAKHMVEFEIEKKL